MLSEAERDILEYLQSFLTRERQERFDQVLALRTQMLTVVLEDVYQPHNQSAVLRTAEALGLQDVHLIESTNRWRIDPQISMGSDRWLSVHRHRGETGTTACLERLHGDGFRILVASPDATATPLNEVAFDQPTALVIGHETDGVSPAALELADECVVVPMRGFVESFNLSVAAAVALVHLRSQLEASDLNWQLSPAEVERLQLDWTRLSIPNVEAIERRYQEEVGEA